VGPGPESRATQGPVPATRRRELPSDYGDLAQRVDRWASPATGALIIEDLLAPQDGLVAFDTETGLRRLDVRPTLELSYDDVLGGAGGWITFGFRHATAGEVCSLFLRHGLGPPSCPGEVAGMGVVANRADDLFPFLGTTLGLSFLTGVFDDGDAANGVGIASQARFVTGPFTLGSGSVLFDQATVEEASNGTGHFLVLIPEPATS